MPQGPQAAMAVTSEENHRSFPEIGGRTKRLCLKIVCWYVCLLQFILFEKNEHYIGSKNHMK